MNHLPPDEPCYESACRAFEAARIQHLRADLQLTPAERLIRLEEMVQEMDDLHGKPPASAGMQLDSFEAFNAYKASRRIVVRRPGTGR